MSGFTSTTIVGNVGREPEFKYTTSGDAVCNFDVAVSRRRTENGESIEDTQWYRVTTWRKLAELCHQYLDKGTQVLCVGEIKARAYTKKDGSIGASLDMTADVVRFLARAREAGQREDDGISAENIPF